MNQIEADSVDTATVSSRVCDISHRGVLPFQMKKGQLREVKLPLVTQWKVLELVFDVMDAQCFSRGGEDHEAVLKQQSVVGGQGLDSTLPSSGCVYMSLTFSAPDMP